MTGRFRRGLAGVILAGLPPIAACDSGGAPAPRRARQQLRIVLVGEAEDDPTWPMLRSMAAAFERRDPRTKIRVVAPKTISPRRQQEILEGLLEEKDHVVCILPSDPAALRASIKSLVKSGRAVVAIGRDVPGSDRSVYCGPAESAVGAAAAAACHLALEGRPRTIMVLHAGATHAIYGTRRRVLMKELPVYGNIHVLKEVDCGGNASNAARQVRVQSRNYPRIGCWVFLEDWALRELPATERLLPLGCASILCNGSPRYFNRVRTGEIQALVAFDYYEAVDKGLEAASRLGVDEASGILPIIAVQPEVIAADHLPAFERRWKAWQAGHASAAGKRG